MPALILLITLTNTASPVWHKSKQNTVVAPSLGPNLNISAELVSSQGQKIHMVSVGSVCVTANSRYCTSPVQPVFKTKRLKLLNTTKNGN